MAQESSTKNELILAQGAQAFVRDDTSGKVKVYVGPKKNNLESTDKPVYFDRDERSFVECSLKEAILPLPFAPEGFYIELENPASSNPGHPQNNSIGENYTLDDGVKINIPGPVTFALWPGQVANVIEGHRLRSNQYLLVRVYNPTAAMENWRTAVMQPAEPTDGEGGTDADVPVEPPPQLTMGQVLVIKGVDVSYYIPPTGIEVVPDDGGEFVREAVTLERLEYCKLLNEDGNERFVRGPDVVFPEPTEEFVLGEGGARKHRAIELNDDMGLYIKVIADYTEGERTYRAGDELFITGHDLRIYYPRKEHAIIRYGDRQVHYGVAIPRGEARYVLNKRTGDVDTVHGPTVLLPDPREQVIVRRVLSDDESLLMFPGRDGNGSQESLAHNRSLRRLSGQAGRPVQEDDLQDMELEAAGVQRRVAGGRMKATFQRNETYTQPRTITLDTKFDGAVAVDIWPNFAIKVMNKAGQSRPEVGPKTVVLDYDEKLQALKLSRGKPKTTDDPLRTVFLQAQFNQVGDIATVQTSDMVDVQVKVSFRVNFEGDATKWFNVDNYVKLLCDRARSILRNLAKTVTVDEFRQRHVDLIRDKILGEPDEETGQRPGYAFDENGMRIYDVEVLSISIDDEEIAEMLTEVQRRAVEKGVELANSQKDLETTRQLHTIRREMMEIEASTATRREELDQDQRKRQQAAEIERIELERQKAEIASKSALETEKERLALQAAELERQKAGADYQRTQQKAAADLARELDRLQEELKLEMTEREVETRIKELKAEAETLKEKGEAISPQLIAALEAFGSREALRDVAKAMAPLGILGGESVSEILSRLLRGTSLEDVAQGLTGGNVRQPEARGQRPRT
ncbi:hypothetical protein ACFL26_00800 [Patescibacteria group bacterium]